MAPLSREDVQAIAGLANDLKVPIGSIGGLMELESGINPNIWGGAGGKYRGLIQFGPGARSEVGLPDGEMTVAQQVPYVRKYFEQRGFKPGQHGVTEMYRTVLVGNPGQSGTDSFGTNSDKAAKDMLPGGAFYERARKKLETAWGGALPSGAAGGMAPGMSLGGMGTSDATREVIDLLGGQSGGMTSRRSSGGGLLGASAAAAALGGASSQPGRPLRMAGGDGLGRAAARVMAIPVATPGTAGAGAAVADLSKALDLDGAGGAIANTAAYIQGGWGPSGANTYGPHFDIKGIDGSFFDRSALDDFVLVNGKPLSTGTTVKGGEFGAMRDGGARVHTGWDYAFGDGAALTLTNGARWLSKERGSYGDAAVFEAGGRRYKILHGLMG